MVYMTTQWIEGHVFRQNVWNHFAKDGRRTNNNLEGWHHRINNSTTKAHKNIFEVVKMLKNYQSVTEVRNAQLDRHWSGQPQNRFTLSLKPE